LIKSISYRSSLLTSSVHFFFYMLRPPLRSTLFPYTTLFRSIKLPLFPKRALRKILFPAEVCGCNFLHVDLIRKKLQPQTSAGKRDRKSTRLNSSHVEISYAVFCLKKKKKYNNNKLQTNKILP